MARSAKLFNFAGITPQLDDALLDANVAMVAQDVDLGRGDIMPFKWPEQLTVGLEQVKTIVEVDLGNIKTLPYDTDVAFGTAASDDLGRVFWIKNSTPMYATRNDFSNGYEFPLGVPRPKNIQISVVEDNPNIDCRSTEGCAAISSFCCTYVNVYGQESAPSGLVEASHYSMGYLRVRITPESLNTDLKINRFRIYRTVASQTTGVESQLASGGEWYLCYEGNIGSIGQGGGHRTESLASTLDIMPSTTWEVPPAADHLAMLPDTDTLVLASKNIVHFSEPGNHHAFPRDRDVVISDNIVGIEYFAGVIIVLTDGHPYVITPSQSERGSPVYNVQREDESYPCVSKSSISVGSTGVVWASTDGVFTVNKTRFGMNIKSLTNTLFHYEDWRGCNPSSIRAALHNGTYFFTSDDPMVNSITGAESRTWMLTYDKTIYDQPKNIFLSSLTITPDVWYKSRTDKLYGGVGMGYFVWNPVNGVVLPYSYTTRVLVEPGLAQYSAAKVIHDEDGDLTFELWRETGSKSKLLYSRSLTHNEPFRLPNVLLSVDHFIKITGTSRVRRVHIADSLLALTRTDDTTMTHGNTRLTQR